MIKLKRDKCTLIVRSFNTCLSVIDRSIRQSISKDLEELNSTIDQLGGIDSIQHPLRLSGKESACQCRTCEFNLWIRKTPGEGNSNPLQYSCLFPGKSNGQRSLASCGPCSHKSQTRLSD